MSTPEQQLPPRSPSDSVGEYQRQRKMLLTALQRVRTASLFEVVRVDRPAAGAVFGLITIKPMLDWLSGDGVAQPHGEISGVMYTRDQCGGNAVLLGDPAPGDIGLVAVCDRDIGVIKRTGKRGAPSSRRMHDMSDAVYVRTVIPSAEPTQYIKASESGIDVHSPKEVRVTAGQKVIITAPQALINGVDHATHRHHVSGSMTLGPVA